MSNKIILGQLREPNAAGRRPRIVYPGQDGVVVVAAPRTGKSLSIVVPNLTQYDGSMFVTDFKGELTIASALWNSVVRKMDVRVFDPFGVVDKKWIPKINGKYAYASYNHIDFIRRSRAPLTAAKRCAEAMISMTSMKDTHWPTAAQNRKAANDLFVALDPCIEEFGLPRNSQTAWRFLSDADMEKQALRHMSNSEIPFVADQANAFLKAKSANVEVQNIRNHLRTACTTTLSEPCIMNTMLETNVDFRQMNSRRMVIYLVLPGDTASSHSPYTRQLLTMGLSDIEFAGLRAFDSTQPPTRFILDEFATLGHFPIIVEAMGRLPGYGVSFMPCVQTLSQLRDIYKDAYGTIMGTAGVVQTFGGTNDCFTADEISKRCGTATVNPQSWSAASRPGEFGGHSFGESGQSVYTPDQIMRLKLPQTIIKVTGENPIREHLLHPSLIDFPDYLAFQECIRQGFDPEDARDFSAQYAVQSSPSAHPERRVAAPAPPKRRTIMFGKLFATIMGHDSD